MNITIGIGIDDLIIEDNVVWIDLESREKALEVWRKWN